MTDTEPLGVLTLAVRLTFQVSQRGYNLREPISSAHQARSGSVPRGEEYVGPWTKALLFLDYAFLLPLTVSFHHAFRSHEVGASMRYPTLLEYGVQIGCCLLVECVCERCLPHFPTAQPAPVVEVQLYAGSEDSTSSARLARQFAVSRCSFLLVLTALQLMGVAAALYLRSALADPAGGVAVWVPLASSVRMTGP